MTREQQKLVYWIITDIANYINGFSVGAKIDEYFIYKTKELIKKEYIKSTGYKIPADPFSSISKLIKSSRNESEEKQIQIIEEGIARCLQDLLLSLNGTFSLALKIMKKDSAIKFINWLFNYCLYNEVPFRKEISELYSMQENNEYIFICLKYRVCAVCGKQGADLHHWKSAAALGGYKQDYGQGEYMSLCRLHHTEFHNIGVKNFEEKYKIKGIKLNDQQLEVLKSKYKNHFKGEKNGRTFNN